MYIRISKYLMFKHVVVQSVLYYGTSKAFYLVTYKNSLVQVIMKTVKL